MKQGRGHSWTWALALVLMALCCVGAASASAAAEEEEEAAVRAAEAELAGKSHYEVLGVATDATLAELKRAFRTLSLSLHPDKVRAGAGAGERAAAHVRFLRAVEAFEALKDPQRRSLYDLMQGARRFGFRWQTSGQEPQAKVPQTLGEKLIKVGLLFVMALLITCGIYSNICTVYAIYGVLYRYRHLWKYVVFLVFAQLLRSSDIDF